jgi:hypothetical protein
MIFVLDDSRVEVREKDGLSFGLQNLGQDEHCGLQGIIPLAAKSK